MITLDDLATELGRRGFPTTTRTLRDWYSKGLIPKPETEGQGPRKGVRRGWTQSQIVNQTTLVASILVIYSDTGTALVSEWLLGYGVDLRRLKKAWKKEGRGLSAQLSLQRGKFLDFEEQARELGTQARRKIKRLRGIKLDAGAANDLAKLLLDDPGTLPVTDELFTILHGFLDPFPMLQRQFEAAGDQLNFPVSIESIRQAMNQELVKPIVARATHTELRRAHKNWNSLTQLARALFPDFLGTFPDHGISSGDQFIVSFGRVVIPQLILNERAGTIEDIEMLIREGLRQVTPISRSQLATLQSGPIPNSAEFKGWISLGSFIEIIAAILPKTAK